MQWVFETLGIDKSADVSTVRKAYAKALKQCDQVAEAERFQRIRQAYEWALQWARQQEMEATVALETSSQEPSIDLFDGTDGQLPVRTPAKAVRLDENEDLSRQVFDEFVAAITLGAAEVGPILTKYAQDVRLTALDAKALFEQAVLVRAFTQPGNIQLLDAACDLFAWDTSSRHLAAVRPDLVHRMLRQQTLRRLLMGNGGSDGRELGEMVSVFAQCQRDSKEKVEPWQIVNANQVLDRYSAFKFELGERYGAEALTWWHDKLRSNANLWAAYDEKRAQAAVLPPPSRPVRRTGGSSAGWLLILPVIVLMNVLNGALSPSHQERTSYQPSSTPLVANPVPADPHKQEMDFLHELADKGDPEAENKLGEIIKVSATGDVDYRSAVGLFRKASDSGLAPAQFNLGAMYEEGHGVTRDLSRAAELYKKAGEKGYAEAQFRLGVMYREGRGVKANAAAAHAWWEKAAKQGYLAAQFNLGLSFAKGEGVKQDYTEAARWWRMAAMRGNANAQGGLGWLYQQGLGVPRDDKAAAQWFRNAASAGDVAAQISLASMYERGVGVSKNPVIAYALLTVAASRGDSPNHDASTAIKRLDGVLSKDQTRSAVDLAGKLRSRNTFLARLDAAVQSQKSDGVHSAI
ncbi:J domain-containing protein [Dyella amyloliquefaciens]|uniref:J domain-containing protein n=1 Tax=Dyella amyloliquefaciens TaxID=1770545 RepID=UPI00102E715F|nr:J domain-containing protein [Dyella amyloliquefaciens]